MPVTTTGGGAGIGSQTTVRYNRPWINDYGLAWGLLDYCGTYNRSCGPATAAAYCAKVESGARPYLSSFKSMDNQVGDVATIELSTRTQCGADGVSCLAFEYVECSTTRK